MVITDLSQNIALHHIAAAFADRVTVKKTYLSAVIEAIWRRHHHFRGILWVGSKILGSRVGSSPCSVCWRGTESIRRRQIRARKEIERHHAAAGYRVFARQPATI